MKKKFKCLSLKETLHLCAQGLQCPFERAYKGVLLIPL